MPLEIKCKFDVDDAVHILEDNKVVICSVESVSIVRDKSEKYPYPKETTINYQLQDVNKNTYTKTEKHCFANKAELLATL